MTVSTGISGLDKLLNGGFPPRTTILLSGEAGTGKTLFGLNFLVNGASKNEKCVYITLNENKEELLRACEGIQPLKNIEKYIEKNLAIENVILGGKITLEYFTKMFSSYPKIERLVIDNVNKLLIFSENRRDYRLHLSELVKYLKNKVNCTLLICETEKDQYDSGNHEAFECDGVVHLDFLEVEEKPSRILEVRKLRYTSFEPRIPHEFVIDSKGLRLTSTRII